MRNRYFLQTQGNREEFPSTLHVFNTLKHAKPVLETLQNHNPSIPLEILAVRSDGDIRYRITYSGRVFLKQPWSLTKELERVSQ